MEPWLFWVILAAVLAVGELVSLSLFLAPFAGGALVAALVDGVTDSLGLSLIAFVVASAALLLALRPVARNHLRSQSSTRTGTAALVGRTAKVLDAGSVKLAGETWTARHYDEDTPLEPGTTVTVMEIEGATALVSE